MNSKHNINENSGCKDKLLEMSYQRYKGKQNENVEIKRLREIKSTLYFT